ncbi:MAG: helix-turn-helix domain-containing protein [Chloroflexota bacterium]
MSPRKFTVAPSSTIEDAVRRLWISMGIRIRDARLGRKWSVPELARRAGISRAATYLIEAGQPTSVEAVTRVASALGLRLDFELTDTRRRAEPSPSLTADVVHSAMGELEASHFRSVGLPVGIDEPYQHYQFAGRADVVAWDLDKAALLHLENRTRFPNVQESIGTFNAKRAYLGDALATRLGVRRWRSETHVMVGAWTAEVLHALRLRAETFRSVCPDPPTAFEGWWHGTPPENARVSILVVLDPLAGRRQRPFIGLDEAIATARPRYRGYADAAHVLVRGHG